MHRRILILLALSAFELALFAHEGTAPWLDPSQLDRGIYLEARRPSVIRRPGAFDVSVVLNNLGAAEDVVLRSIRYEVDGGPVVIHTLDQLLATKRREYDRYREVRQQMHDLADRGIDAGIEALSVENRALLREITSSSLRDSYRVGALLVPERTGSKLQVEVTVELMQAGELRSLQRVLEIPIEAPLPRGVGAQNWFSGDQHLHTRYSIDAFFLDSTRENVADYAAVANVVGLDWITTTDHSNVHLGTATIGWYTERQFDRGEAEAAAVRAAGYLALEGQEMGIGRTGFFGEGAHLLAYPYTVDSMGYLPNPSSGLLFNHANCEPEQVILDRVNQAGGLGFIAHPFNTGILVFWSWDFDNNATGWAGMEIFSSSLGDTDQEAYGKWHELLGEIPAPVNGQLQPRPNYPTTFPVGIGNSDAHEVTSIGRTFSYSRLDSGTATRADVMNAFVAGKVVASNGPLVYGEIEGAGLGEVAVMNRLFNQIDITLQTTPEFGPVGNYQLTVIVDGQPRFLVPPSGSQAFQVTLPITGLLASPDKFVTLRADSNDGLWHALANPIWLEWPQ